MCFKKKKQLGQHFQHKNEKSNTNINPFKREDFFLIVNKLYNITRMSEIRSVNPPVVEGCLNPARGKREDLVPQQRAVD